MQNNEDDTFRVLRRAPYTEVIHHKGSSPDYFNALLYYISLKPEEHDDSATARRIQAQYIDMIHSANWTVKEYISELQRRITAKEATDEQ